ncbi:hypothetical protein F4777DRAFT_548715 [Nemania sp. FL0916]|nr:hypothetical protein F4777DRAFT_548715 [Nemania sp. FL0916]
MVAKGSTGAVAVIDARGNCAIESTARSFSAIAGPRSIAPPSCFMQSTIPIFPAHTIYRDQNLLAGQSRFPTTHGHTLITLLSNRNLFSLGIETFSKSMLKVSSLASTVAEYFQVRRVAFVSDGSESMSLLPLHGLESTWTPVTSNLKEFHECFPGYVSSKDGPKMSDKRLDIICAKIRAETSASEPFNNDFDGSLQDVNLFARIVRGEVQQWRVWEDDHHVAFLTPFPNTPGFTVLVPRRHLSSDVFRIEEEPYTKLMEAAYTVGQILKAAFNSSRCGMIFEGFEIDYPHVKLIPIHDSKKNDGTFEEAPLKALPFQSKYEGYVSSLHGESLGDVSKLSEDSEALRALLPTPRARAPRSWAEPSRHLVTVLQDPWYKNLFIAQDALYHVSVKYFRETLGYKYCFLPASTDAVSSPMGLGSDSEPVAIRLLGQDTHLADSMQFCLEYALRIQPEVPGVYYINTSFRGEDVDAMHLNQFYHVECEFLGGFDEGIGVAERYVVALVEGFLQDHADAIRTTAGTTKHLEDLLEYYSCHDRGFPQISLSEALKLPGMDESCWNYVLDSDPSKGQSLTRRGELKLIEYSRGPVWLTNMNHLSVPFYQAYTDETRSTARCADLLLGNGEVLGLGERHLTSDLVREALQHHQVPGGGYAWYMDMRDIQQIQTTGWGMGIERFLAWAFQWTDIRDLALVPRMKGSRFAP